ncbi:MAG: MATE family efflux transporter [Firmicutes bacterium]|nr:MATE family efflux transporter [Bacillota bacterium]
MKNKKSADNRMATEPVGKLMVSVGVPIVLSMMLQAVYNIVDSAYLSNMQEAGEEALTALSLAFPVQLFMVAIAIGTGVGTNALLSKSMGEGNKKKASRAAGNAVFVAFVIYAVFVLFGLFGVSAYVNSQNAGGSIGAGVLTMTEDYLRICCCISFGIVFFSIYEKILQSMGRSLYSTIAQVAGAVVNIVLDPILIYGWLGFPQMGVKGAAYATVIGQIMSAVLAFAFHTKLNVEIDKSIKYLRPRLRILKEIFAVGLPAIISQALLTVMTYGLNIIFGKIPQVGENTVTVYGLYCKIQQLITFAAFGMRDVITPIVAFNYGMKDKKRIKDGIKYGMLYTLVLMAAGLAAIELLTEPLIGFFALSDVTHTICVQCMRIVSLGLIFAGASIAFQGIFQALQRGIESMVISFGRQVIFILPAAWILAKFVTGAENVSIVWWSFLIGEGLTAICAGLMYIPVMKKKINVLE